MRRLIKACRKKRYSTVVCGKYATYASHEDLSDLDANVYLKYSAEMSLRELVINFSKNTSDNNRYTRFSDLPIPNRALLEHPYIDVKSILTSRGCHQRCSFCHVPNFWGAWTPRTITDILHEIRNLSKITTKILFLDDNFSVNRKHTINILQKLRTLNKNIAYGALCSADSLNIDILEMMCDATSKWLHLKLETGDPNLIKYANKRLSIEHIITLVQTARTLGIRIRLSVIVDLPETTETSFLQTQDILSKANPDEIRIHFLCNRMEVHGLTRC